jgi:hypothetical protein
MNRKARFSTDKSWLVCSLLLMIVAGCATHSNETRLVDSSSAVCETGNCGSRCGRCQKPCQRARRCPKCQTDACYLCAECVCEETECFEVEQKVICIPPVSLPRLRRDECGDDCGSRCSKKCAKTKVVKVLKTRSCKCPTCQYTWKLCEAPLPERSPYSQVDPRNDAQPEVPIIRQPGFEGDGLYDPAGSDVPGAPGPVPSIK